MPTRLASGRWSLVLAFACAAWGCSRHEPGDAPQKPSASASASATAARAKPEESKRPTPPPPAPITPAVPPQLVACGSGRDFYRITDKALEVFEVSKDIPPPQIRGSAAALQVARLETPAALNVVPLKRGVLVIGGRSLFRYEPGHKQLRDSGPMPATAPLVAWSDPKRTGAFWVRALCDASLHQYTLAVAPKAAPVEREQALAGFDSRLFAVLADGALLFSTASGLVRQGDEGQPSSAPKLPEHARLIFPDVAPGRYWTADAHGNLSQWALDPGAAAGAAVPLFSARVPGAVIDMALEGAHVAVLSIEARDQAYRPTVTVFSDGKQLAQRRVSWTPGSSGQPQLDLCLIPGRPWVVVGGKRWLQLVDWQTPRLLSEW